MTEVTGPFSPLTWDMTHHTEDHGFAVGDRVVWLDSLEWGDHWEIGTITKIEHVGFATLREVHTLASVAWDDPRPTRKGAVPLDTSREGLTPRGPYPVTIDHTYNHPDKINPEGLTHDAPAPATVR